PYKGWDVLLESWPDVVTELPEARLVIAGEPWGRARRLGSEDMPSGATWLPGYMPDEDRAVWLDACDVVVCPYRSATGSGIAADAFAHGRPVICTRVSGLAEVIEEGVTGLLVPPEAPRPLAEAMVRFVKEGRGAAMEQAVLDQRSRFSHDAYARSLL